jgi:dimethylargininase
LPRDEDYPDSVFVEDTAVLTDKFAVITNPGAPSRKGEVISIKEELLKLYAEIEEIQYPGTLDGGDVMKVREHFYIGLSSRTNQEGADQFVNILQKYGYSNSIIRLKSMLHLKTGVSYLGNNDLLVAGEMISIEEFTNFNRIEVPQEESYSANCISANDNILLASGFPETRGKISSAGYSIIELNMSEFRKIDGGLSCLSLRF